MIKRNIIHHLLLLLLFGGCFCKQDTVIGQLRKKGTFHNPILSSGPDPYVFFKDGYYYYTHTEGSQISLRKTANMADLEQAEKKIIWSAPKERLSYSREIWAPEIIYMKGIWYAYFSADDGDNKNHRIYVLESRSEDPMADTWEFKGLLELPDNKWAIDADVFSYKGKWYVIWSGWEGDVNGQQNIYISQLNEPLKAGSKRICISRPLYTWEKYGDLRSTEIPSHINVNEGPQALIHNDNLFIVYSASACWTDRYALGLLQLKGNDVLDATQWTKSREPVFQQYPENNIYATGHNSFFKSTDGTEDWILYHANNNPNEGCGNKRSPHMQPFYWSEEGKPIFGIPLSESAIQNSPSE